MRKMIKTLFLSILLVSCASVYIPPVNNISNKMEVNISYNDAISLTCEFLNQYDLMVENISKESGFINASGDLKKYHKLRWMAGVEYLQIIQFPSVEIVELAD